MPLLDNRGLMPPEPMIRVMQAVENLGADQVLEVINDRRPLFLYPILDEHGLIHETLEQPDGTVHIHIRRKPR